MRINSPIEQRNTGKGNPTAIVHFDRPLNATQEALLNTMPESGSEIRRPKKDVRLSDLAALTAATGDEFALFTRKGERLIVRGGPLNTPIDENKAKEMATQGWKWSGHTHPGTDGFCLFASDGDKLILRAFSQNQSCILNSMGRWTIFDAEEG